MISYVVSDRIATITIDDPERRNPLTNAAMSELRDALRRAADDDAVRVIVITGAGDRAFSAGGDLSGGFVDAPLEGHFERGALAEVFEAMTGNPKPVIARVNGVALGGGFGLAVAADITIASDDARFGTPEIDLALWPMMISAVLMRNAPRKALMEMMMTGKVISAHEAKELGLVNDVVAADELDARTRRFADALIERSSAALALGKRAFHAIGDMDLTIALDYLHLGLTATALTEDGVEGVTAFLEKRDPEWKGR